jgi:uncharacterized membrane protein YcaP (DUF421 family)
MATIFIRTLIIYFALIIAMRMMGKRQIGQLEITDLVSTLLLSEIATLPIENQDIPVIYAIIPIIIIMTAEIVSAALPTKFPKLKNIFSTRPETLVRMGAPDLEALKAARMTSDELMVALRKNGISDIDEVGYAILEQDGSVSVLPRAQQRPATAADVGKSPSENGMFHIMIDGGKINMHSLAAAKQSRAWLERQLISRNLKAENIALMLSDESGNVRIFTDKDEKK